ncbi:MAG: FKBP-type peptidyl-prolyl cis-trans isomerase [Bacteroidia bacterium]
MKIIPQLLAITFALVTISATAQKKSKSTNKPAAYNISPLGMKYKLHKTNKGVKAKTGDFIKIHLINKTEKDSVLSSSYETGQPLALEITKPTFKGDLMEGFTFMSEGDSGTFLVSIDSLAQGQPLPPFLKSGDFLKFDVKLIDIMTKEEYAKEMDLAQMEEMAKEQMEVQKQAQTIEKYAKEKNLKVQKTASGLYYVIENEGTGNAVQAGNKVSVHYKGYTLDGKVFDESFSRGEPITFPLGVGQVIAGWDEGIALFKKGGKGKLLIPSPLAYGSRGSGPIAANSILIFDIELVDVIK